MFYWFIWKMWSVHYIGSTFNIQNLYQILCLWMRFIAYSYTANIFIQDWGSLWIFWIFSVVVLHQLESEYFKGLVTHILAHCPLFTKSCFITSEHFCICSNIATSCRNSLIQCDYGCVVLTSSFYCIIFKSNLG